MEGNQMHGHGYCQIQLHNWAHCNACSLSTGALRQEDLEFQVGLNYPVSSDNLSQKQPSNTNSGNLASKVLQA